ncbi:putative carboxylesterase [Leptodontidium sp. 2 PMI_412]|nr:putative carboxylesterase [Leptodontidium sp. 2 PMI_412]
MLLSYILFFLTCSGQAQQLSVPLDYGTFQGKYSSTYNINYWRKIPFAAPPVGENRFRAPQPPIPITNETYDSDQQFELCPQRTVNGSEDCLYLGLYSRPWTPAEPLRPVVIFFHGGGFIRGGGPFAIPPGGYPVLNMTNSTDLLFIYPNYRVNAFGFLPGAEVAASPTSDLNPGLLDQRAQFGGDPKDVSIWGQSAGAGSVIAQVLANGNSSPRLFSKAVASSPFWSKTYKYDSIESQTVYDTFANLSGCAGPESLKCLKTADLQVLRTAALQIAGSNEFTTSSFTWGPVIDGKFLKKPLSELTKKGDVDIDLGWGFYNTHEGENFIPPGLANEASSGTPPFNSSTASFDGWVKGFLPKFSDRNLRRLKEQYPAVGSTETISSYNTTYVRAGLIFRDVVLACPAYWMARGARKKSYVGEYTISPAKHASDTQFWNQVNAVQKTQSLIYNGFTGAFASFFQTGDPNTNKLTDSSQPGVPEIWKTGKEFVVNSDGFENLRVDVLAKRCAFWKDVAEFVPI